MWDLFRRELINEKVDIWVSTRKAFLFRTVVSVWGLIACAPLAMMRIVFDVKLDLKLCILLRNAAGPRVPAVQNCVPEIGI